MPSPLDITEIQPDEELDYEFPLAVDGWDDFIEVKLPDRFLLQDDAGNTEGEYHWRDFDRDEFTGAYVCQTEGRLLILRVLSAFDYDRDLRVLDGDGRLWRYRVLDPDDPTGVEKTEPARPAGGRPLPRPRPLNGRIDYAAGVQHRESVGAKRASWMEREAARMLKSLSPDEPTYDYWRGVAGE